MAASLENYFRNLNIFDSDINTPGERRDHEHRSNQIATRIFFLILLIILIIVVLFFLLYSQTITITVHNPSKEQFENLPYNVYCPCSHISMFYEEFVTIEARFHQVCSSDFVSNRWIRTIFTGSNATYFYGLDFRTYGSASFQALASFCRLSKDNVLQNIVSFNKMSFISPEILSQTEFQSQIDASIEQFQLFASNEFQTQLNFVQDMITLSKLQSGLQTNYLFAYSAFDNNQFIVYRSSLSYRSRSTNSCVCTTDMNCKISSKIYNIFGEARQITNVNNVGSLMDINGFILSYLLVNSILFSTLECFYNQICLNKLISYFPVNDKFIAMTISNKSRFNINSTIKMIVNQLMIEEWITNISYDKYYTKCQPNLCTYTIKKKFTFMFILTKLISLLGGLILIIGFIVRYSVRIIRRLPRIEPITLSQRLKNIFEKIWLNLNIFKHNGSNEHQHKYQRIATRLYLFILLIILFLFTLYILLIDEVHHINISKPIESEYKQLEEKYSDNIICPCSSIKMNYSTFITIQPYYHQLCSSDLITPEWINYNVVGIQGLTYLNIDYRSNAQSHFQLLAMFCQQAKQIVNSSIETFLQTQFVSSKIDSRNLFESKMKLFISNWKSTILKRFLRIIKTFQIIIQGNLLMNIGLNVDTTSTNSSYRETKIQIPIGQFRLLTSLCELSQETINDNLIQLLTSNYINQKLLSEQLFDQLSQTTMNQFQLITPDLFLNIFNLIREMTGTNMIMSTWSTNWIFFTERIINPQWAAHTIPIIYQECNCGLSWKCTQSYRSMMIGCYPLETLLKTNLQCFYNQDCIDSTKTFQQLNISSLKLSQFHINTTIESILNNLMIEEYVINKSYENYFNQCSPSSCLYTYMEDYQLTQGILSIIGLYSGLEILTRCLSILLVKLYLRYTNTITPETTE
ncbi:hypothetical protein I4U23_022288 [Adineta vaga]|nr:hypothetical protein I4U23_022288 [Adineta vaga]